MGTIEPLLVISVLSLSDNTKKGFELEINFELDLFSQSASGSLRRIKVVYGPLHINDERPVIVSLSSSSSLAAHQSRKWPRRLFT